MASLMNGSAPAARAMLEITAVSKRFGGVAAVDECSLQVPGEGSITGLIGPNGSGKTTLFNLISGVHGPDAGEIRFRGQRIDGMSPGQVYRQGIGRTFQMARIFARLTALENMLVTLRPHGWRGTVGGFRGAAETDAARTMLARLGLSHVEDQLAGRLSYGQRRLIEMGALMMSRPAMVLLDEPAAGVHPGVVDVIAEYVTDACAQGVTFIIVEHNLNFVMDVCHRVIVLDRGRPIAEGPPAEVQASPVVLDAYLGD
jgi:neutral amino acid transport system ATP-binding protein